MRRQWCLPPEARGEFVWRLEEVLEVETRPDDPRRPLLCLDETSQQFRRETRPSQRPAPGRPARMAYEYARQGTLHRLLCGEPLAGRRWVDVTARRTKRDWAHPIQQLGDVRYPDAERLVLVLDNLNTHTPGALYDAFPPAEAKRLTDKLELPQTPKHGRWLNLAEIELSVLSRQCLDRRLPDGHTLAREVAAWQEQCNATTCTVDWRFTTADARIKLKRLYPSLHE